MALTSTAPQPQLEPFAPLDDNKVRMYSCAPQFNYVHIGNLRTFTFQDILRRYLRRQGWKLRHVMNITDVDDKIIATRSGRQSIANSRPNTARPLKTTPPPCGSSRPSKSRPRPNISAT
jgi:cysteinyl-tRNA synthetase